jgi:ATP-dependent Lhr-like helicase
MKGVTDYLQLFSPPVAGWFSTTYPGPTPPQELGWPAIARGEHALIVSPTGSGKTLTAFLWSLDRLFRDLAANPEPPKGHRGPSEYRPGVRVLYISPLKALNNDVERNLQVPLAGIERMARAMGETLPELRVAVRTGDTPAADRQKMLRRPPQILITTPESLYLMLTSERARHLFATTHTVIVDEIHTLVATKRGAHLALSLERLERVAEGKLQRIGLSATVRPLATAAHFLGGQTDDAVGAPRPVTVVDASYPKPLDLEVVSLVEDFRETPGNSIWPTIIPEVSRLVDSHRTTLIFCNSRRLAERTADRLNDFRLNERLVALGRTSAIAPAVPGDLGIFAVGVDARALRAVGLEPIRAHHGSTSKPARLEMESALKSGALPALVCTSSLELGIDIGEIDLVVHLQSPKSVASGLQRVGRSGHLVGQTSVGRIFPTHVDDVLEAAAVCRGMLRGEIEASATPENPLDILAQQLVAMVSVEDWTTGDALALARRAYPYRNLSELSFTGVVEMLSGKYPESISRQLKARISWDRVNDRLTALPGSNNLAIGSGGTIPDRGSYSLVLGDRRTRIGELDEEFVFETRLGDTFLFGSNVWRALEITDDRVIAEPAPGETPRMPFWRGDAPWRPYDLGKRIGGVRRELAELVGDLTGEELDAIHAAAGPRPGEPRPNDAGTDPRRQLTPRAARLLGFLTRECALDRNSAIIAIDYLARQLDAVGRIATDQAIVVETFEDAIGEPRLVVHSPFGGRVHGPWSVVLAGAMRDRLGVEPQATVGDDGFLLRFTNAEVEPPVDLVSAITSGEARERLVADLPNTATFGAQFRMNAARALLLPRERAGKRTPLWLSRLRAKDLLQAVGQHGDFPILLETFRDCLRDVMDLPGLTEVLDGIHRREIEVVLDEARVPSPVALGLDRRFAMQYVYEYDQPRGERQLSALSVDRSLLADLLHDGSLADLLKPAAIAEVATRAGRLGPTDRARDAEELAQLLFEFGDLSNEEIQSRSVGTQGEQWLAELVNSRRVVPWQFGDDERWVHAERTREYEDLSRDPRPVLLRFLAHAGPTDLARLAERYDLPPDSVQEALREAGSLVAVGRFAGERDEQWIDRANLDQIHRRTLSLLRQEVQPVPFTSYAAFLQGWHGIGGRPFVTQSAATSDQDSTERGSRLILVLQQLRGLALPGSIWERDVLPARVPGFDAGELGEKFQSGELMWVAEGSKDPQRARVRFFFRGDGGLFLERKADDAANQALGQDARAIYDYLAEEGAALLADIAEGAGLTLAAGRAALVELVLAGLVTNDSLDALRGVLGYEPPLQARDQPRSALEVQLASLRTDPQRVISRQRLRDSRRRAREVVAAGARARRTPWVGRWSLVHRPSLLGKPLTGDELVTRQARQLLARWGVVSRACLDREAPLLRWDQIYPALSTLETRGTVRRGYFVTGLPGLQFALPEVVEKLRATHGEAARATVIGPDRARGADPAGAIVVLNAADPVQLFGSEESGGPFRFARLASTAVASVHGEPVAVFEDAGAAVLADEDHPSIVASLAELGRWWLRRTEQRLRVERWNGIPIFESAGPTLLEAAGFIREYGGMTLLPESSTR